MAINTEYQGTGTANGDPMGHAKKAIDEARAFKEAFASKANEFSTSIDLRGRVQRNPLGMVAAALGVGYVLGGGLFSPFTARLAKYGVRLALIPMLKAQIGAALGGQETGGTDGPVV